MNVTQLIEAKKEKGYSNAMISRLSGVPLATVQKIFSGETESPRYDTVQALSKMFEQKTVYYSDTGSMNDSGMVKEAMPAYGVNIPVKKRNVDYGDKNIDDYEALPESARIEMINGTFYDMAAPTTIHQRISLELAVLFNDHIKKNNGDCMTFIAPTDVRIDCDDKTMLQPDVFVVCNRDRITKKWIEGAPDLVVEILSPSNVFMDLGIKYAKYSGAGVREYWIINPEDKNLMVHRLFDNSEPKLYTFEDSVPVGIWNDECVIDFKTIYQNIEFMYSL